MNGKMISILSCIAVVAACGGDPAALGQTQQAIAAGNIGVGTHSPFKCGLAPSDQPVDDNDPGTYRAARAMELGEVLPEPWTAAFLNTYVQEQRNEGESVYLIVAAGYKLCSEQHTYGVQVLQRATLLNQPPLGIDPFVQSLALPADGLLAQRFLVENRSRQGDQQ